MEWRPIDGCKIGEIVDIWSKSEGRLTNYVKVKVSNKNIFFEPVYSGPCVVRDATHFMNIPEPPK